MDIPVIHSATINKYQEILNEFLKNNPKFDRTPITNTFNVKYYGGENSSFEKITDLIKTDLNNNDSYSLYLHYPYCQYICEFCHYPVLKFPKKINATPDIINLLSKHNDLLLEKFPELRDKEVSSFYLGGGTPSLLDSSDLDNLKKNIIDKIKFSKDAELTIESTPDSMNKDRIEKLINTGFNRISMGVQVLDDNALQIFKRDHNVEQALNIIKCLEQFDNVSNNIDLMYGLPGVSTEKFLKDIETIASTGVDSITLYRLRLGRIDERKAAMYADYTKSKEKFPSQVETSIQIMAAREMLAEMKYGECPAGWFNKIHRHGVVHNFVGMPVHTNAYYDITSSKVYEDRWLSQKPMFGLGISAYSYGKNWQYLNANNLNDYGNKIYKGIIPFAEGISLNRLETDLRHIAFLLRYGSEIKLSDCRKDNSERIKSIFAELEDLNLAYFENNSWQLTELGVVFIDEIIDNYFQKKSSYYKNSGRL